MLNKEKYAKELEDMVSDIIAVSKSGKLGRCIYTVDCSNCKFHGHGCDGGAMDWLNSEYEEQILDKVEKKYLKSVVNPFRDKVLYIQKASIGTDNIRIGIKNDNTINLPCFKKDTMYKGMKAWEKYTLEDLGI